MADPVQHLTIGGSRRTTLQAGALSLFGLSPLTLQSLAVSDDAPAKSCVFVFLFGGPSHIDLWDMKPQAPLEIRGEFRPVSTSVTGVHICEHLPQMTRIMDRLCLLRSMTHRMPVHGPACSEVYTGRPYFGPPVTDQATPEDWPSLTSLVNALGSRAAGMPQSVVLPWFTQFNGQDKRIAGQTGGRLGDHFDPFPVDGDPTADDFSVAGLTLPKDVSMERFARRQAFRKTFNTDSMRRLDVRRTQKLEDRYQAAERLILASGSQSAFRLSDEPAAVREMYGQTSFGQSLLLARRLIESGISLVNVNWFDESRTDKVSPHWDTHHNNFPTLRERLCPIFDRAFPAFIRDLESRGLLDSTLVVALGEFGRTPRIGRITQNGGTQKTGRDHWPHAFTALLAGGGVRGGQVYGATNATGGYVDNQPVTPADLSATILTHLGVDPGTEWFDRFQNVTRPVSVGKPVTDLG